MKAITEKARTFARVCLVLLFVASAAGTEVVPSPLGVTGTAAQRCATGHDERAQRACERLRRSQNRRCSGDGPLCTEMSICASWFGVQHCRSFATRFYRDGSSGGDGSGGNGGGDSDSGWLECAQDCNEFTNGGEWTECLSQCDVEH